MKLRDSFATVSQIVKTNPDLISLKHQNKTESGNSTKMASS